ncbi:MULTISPECIES: hypothetical protein [Burkholderia]|uniref:hypothetical protein n=1 Tax=Burkholderia TaxID=32008 RepID=UPI0009E95878|nr:MULTISPECIES: hypothetical protein [Burkholderia]
MIAWNGRESASVPSKSKAMSLQAKFYSLCLSWPKGNRRIDNARDCVTKRADDEIALNESDDSNHSLGCTRAPRTKRTGRRARATPPGQAHSS